MSSPDFSFSCKVGSTVTTGPHDWVTQWLNLVASSRQHRGSVVCHGQPQSPRTLLTSHADVASCSLSCWNEVWTSPGKSQSGPSLRLADSVGGFSQINNSSFLLGPPPPDTPTAAAPSSCWEELVVSEGWRLGQEEEEAGNTGHRGRCWDAGKPPWPWNPHACVCVCVCLCVFAVSQFQGTPSCVAE